jgi:lambda family phage portal protein
MNLIDNIVSIFDPVAGATRAAARQVIALHKREYAAAKSGRRNKGWKGRGTSANVEVGSAFVTLRNRAREFVRDSWAGQRILDVLTSHVVGTGIMSVPDSGSDADDQKYKLVREEWEENADVEGILPYGAIQALSMRSMAEGGDCVLRFIDTPFVEKGPLSLRLQGLEGDSIDSSRVSLPQGDDVRLGVKLGEWGVREGLYLHKVHPGEMSVTSIEASKLVPWDELCHVYRPLRFGQVRGITWFAPILLTAREIQDMMEAAIVQQRTQASYAGFIHRTTGGGASPFQTQKDSAGNNITRIEPGTIVDIGENEIQFANPSSQSVFGESYMAGMQAMAAGAGMTYDQLTGDLRQANFSSLRAGKIEFRRLVEQIQWHCLVPNLCRKVDLRFESRAILAGKLKPITGGYRVNHVMPAVEPIDPKKDLDADISAVRAGRMSPQEFISGWGRDWRKVVKDSSAFQSFCDSHNIKFDIDPRQPIAGSPPATPETKDKDDE